MATQEELKIAQAIRNRPKIETTYEPETNKFGVTFRVGQIVKEKGTPGLLEICGFYRMEQCEKRPYLPLPLIWALIKEPGTEKVGDGAAHLNHLSHSK